MQSRTSFFLTLAVLSFVFVIIGTSAIDFGVTLTRERLGMIVAAGCVAFCSFIAYIASYSAQRG